MSSSRAIKQLKSVWGRAGLDRVPSPEETKGNIDPKLAGPQQVRKKSARTARLDLRVTPDEKRRLELRAVAEGVGQNEIFSRMQALYEETHGHVELSATRKGHTKSND
jgi:hypothetical protein